MIWIVRLGDDFYVRSAYGRGSAWFRAVQTQHQGRISCKVIEKDVIFLHADKNLKRGDRCCLSWQYHRNGAEYVS
jgi:hypothetical protein